MHNVTVLNLVYVDSVSRCTSSLCALWFNWIHAKKVCLIFRFYFHLKWWIWAALFSISNHVCSFLCAFMQLQSSIHCRWCFEVGGPVLQLGNGGMWFALFIYSAFIIDLNLFFVLMIRSISNHSRPLDFQKPDDEDAEFLSHEEDFRLPQSFFADEENWDNTIIFSSST